MFCGFRSEADGGYRHEYDQYQPPLRPRRGYIRRDAVDSARCGELRSPSTGRPIGLDSRQAGLDYIASGHTDLDRPRSPRLGSRGVHDSIAHNSAPSRTTATDIDMSRTTSASSASRPASSTPRSSTTSPSLTRTAPSLTSRRSVDLLHVINEAVNRPAVESGGIDIPSCYTDSVMDINDTPLRLNHRTTTYASSTAKSFYYLNSSVNIYLFGRTHPTLGCCATYGTTIFPFSYCRCTPDRFDKDGLGGWTLSPPYSQASTPSM